MGKFKYSFTHC